MTRADLYKRQAIMRDLLVDLPDCNIISAELNSDYPDGLLHVSAPPSEVKIWRVCLWEHIAKKKEYDYHYFATASGVTILTLEKNSGGYVPE